MSRFFAPFVIAISAVGAAAQEPAPPPEATPPAAPEVPSEEDEEGDGRIVGGYPANRQNALWQAQIFAKGAAEYTPEEIEADRIRTDGKSKFHWMKPPWELNHRCGGVLIAKDWIVTAAHCAKLPRPGNLLKERGVRLGTLSLTGGGATYRIERVVTHKDYDAARHIHDIALMRIVPEGAPAPRNTIAVIRLLGSKPGDLPVEANPFVTVTGWGLTGERSGSMTFMRDGKTVNRKSPQLMEVALKILPQSVCAKQENYRSAMIPEIICAGSNDGRDSCNGDSGGPMTRAEGRDRVLVGLVSFGNGCGIKGMPGLYVNAGAYRQWIRDAIQASRPGQVGRF